MYQGTWSQKEQQLHINVLEIRGGYQYAQSSTTFLQVDRPSGVRQLNSGHLHQQGRRNAFPILDAGNNEPVRSGTAETVDIESKTYSWQTQCCGRPVVQERSISPHRMDVEEGSSSQVARAVDRPLPHKTQHTTICVSSAGSTGVCSGRADSGFQRTGRICISATSDPGKRAPEKPASRAVQADSDSSVLAQAVVVPAAQPVSSGGASTSALSQVSTQTTLDRFLIFRPGSAITSRLEASEAYLISVKGFEEKVAKRIAAPQAQSTSRVYDKKWQKWLEWCQENNVDVLYTDTPQVANFLVYLFEVKKFQGETIKGYRSMLSSALRHHSGINVGRDKDLSDLIQALEVERPPRSREQPTWDLSFILWSLTQVPFEPIRDTDKVNLKFLTWKTCFLLLLASGARRGELHAIKAKNVTYSESKQTLTLKPSVEFLSKVRLSRGGQVLQPFIIKSLCKILPPEELDRVLCPVRCTKVYLTRTKDIRKDKKLLLLSEQPNFATDIKVNTISGWMRDLIECCYRAQHLKALELMGERFTHEIRAKAASMVFGANAPMEDVLAAGLWKNHNTFTQHYLRDLSEDQDRWHHLGPIVAGKAVVNSTNC